MTGMHPYGSCPIRSRHLQDVSIIVTVIPRTMVEVKYYSVDYGISSYFPPGSQARLVVGTDGRDTYQNCLMMYRTIHSRSIYSQLATYFANCFAMYAVNVLGPMTLIDRHPEIFQLRVFPTPYRIHDAERSYRPALSGTGIRTLAINQAPCQIFASALEATRKRRIGS